MRDEIIRSTFEELDQSLRPASIAQLGGHRPLNDPITSRFGGGFYARSDEYWPEFDGLPSLGLLQVRCDELPAIPEQLKDIALFTIYFTAAEPPKDLPRKSGEGWMIRTYRTLEGLEPIKSPMDPTPMRSVPMRWALVRDEAPGWDDSVNIADMRAFNKLPDAVDLFFERYSNHPFTKVGGWPLYIKNTPGKPYQYVLQISSEEKVRWILDKSGNIYVYRNEDGSWELHWDSY